MILLSGAMVPGSDLTGTPLTQAALREHIGIPGEWFIAIAILLFAFTSIIGNYTYAENAMVFFRLGGRAWISLLRIGALAMVIWGSYESVSTVFNAADASMGLMATINIISIGLLSGTVAKLTRDYIAQRKAGRRPEFHLGDYPKLTGEVDASIWSRRS